MGKALRSNNFMFYNEQLKLSLVFVALIPAVVDVKRAVKLVTDSCSVFTQFGAIIKQSFDCSVQEENAAPGICSHC